ncbi:MAG: hypothetical protein RJB38_1167 [Pseudomonadota bacterium]|jgi:hypothetical protein
MSSISTSSSSYPASYLRDLQQDLETEKKKARQNVDASEAEHEEAQNQLRAKLEEQSERTISRMRDNQERAVKADRDYQRAENARVRKENYDRLGKLTADQNREKDTVRTRVDQALEQASARVDRAEKDINARARKTLEASKEREQNEAEKLHASHRAQIKDLTQTRTRSADYEKRYQNERANGRRDGYSEIENDFLDQRRTIESQYQTEMNELKKHYAKQTDRSDERHSEAIKNLKLDQSAMIQEMESGHHREKRDLDDKYQESLQQIAMREGSSEDAFERKMQQERDATRGQFDQAFREQAKNYQSRIDQKRDDYRFENDRLKADLKEARSSPDVHRLPAAATQKIQEQAEKAADQRIREREQQFQETLKTTKDRARQTYADQIQDHQRQMSSLSREKIRNELLSQSKMAHISSDAEDRVSGTRLDSERQLTRTINNSQRVHGRELDVMKRRYDELLEEVKNDAADKLVLLREELEFQNRMAHRTFAARENELIRDHEKRLEDVKAEATEALDRAKEASEKTVRDLEQKHREQIDKFALSNDRRVQQLEQQYQNRERVIAKNYQEELEKIKRSHAQKNTKKS